MFFALALVITLIGAAQGSVESVGIILQELLPDAVASHRIFGGIPGSGAEIFALQPGTKNFAFFVCGADMGRRVAAYVELIVIYVFTNQSIMWLEGVLVFFLAISASVFASAWQRMDEVNYQRACCMIAQKPMREC